MISLAQASQAERGALENLMQLYIHDWSELMPQELGPDGRFAPYPLEAYWRDANRHPLLLRVDGNLAGFALITGHSHLTGATGVYDMTEFFVVRRHRRRGVGTIAAAAAFDRFNGPWEVRQRDDNAAATAFWRSAIARYTGGEFQEEHRRDSNWTGPIQRFASRRGARDG